MKTNYLLLTILFVTSCFTITAQRGVRVAYIDMEYILESVPEYQEASVQLEGKVQRWKADIEKMNDEIDQMKLNLANERVLLTTELIEEREEEIKLKEDEMLKYQQDRFGPGGDLDIQRRRLVQPIQDQVFNLVQEFGENRKYDFILDRSTDPSMLFAAERHDLSDEVLRSINRAAKREEAQTRKEEREIERREALSAEEEGAITEREEKIEERKNEREKQMEERRRVRDSIRDAKKAEFEARRQRLLEERERRRDSLLEARQNRNTENNTPEEGNGGTENGEGSNNN